MFKPKGLKSFSFFHPENLIGISRQRPQRVGTSRRGQQSDISHCQARPHCLHLLTKMPFMCSDRCETPPASAPKNRSWLPLCIQACISSFQGGGLPCRSQYPLIPGEVFGFQSVKAYFAVKVSVGFRDPASSHYGFQLCFTERSFCTFKELLCFVCDTFCYSSLFLFVAKCYQWYIISKSFHDGRVLYLCIYP